MADSPPTPPPPAGSSNAALVRRLLDLSWRYRGACIRVLAYQVVLLAMGVFGLGMTGLAVDFLRHLMVPDTPAPLWPFGLAPPAGWQPMTVVGLIAGTILAMAVARALLNYLYAMTAARLIQQEIVVSLRAQVYDKLQRLSFRFFDLHASGSLINRITGDVQSVRSFVDGVLVQSVIMALSLAVYLTWMLQVHVGLTLACLAPMPLLWLSTTLFSRWVQPEYARNRELADRLTLTLTESVQGIQVTKGFSREPEEAAKFAGANRAVLDQQHSIFWKVSLFTPAIDTLAQVPLIVLLGYGGWLVIQNQLPVGTGLMVFVGLLQQFSGQISSIAGITNNIQQSLIGARRVFEVLDAPIEVGSRPDALRRPRLDGEVRFAGVGFAYQPGEPVLEELTFSVAPGQCVAILGATGAGKTTLLHLLPRFYDPTSGSILIDGIDTRQLHLADLRRNIGLVFQESFLFSNTVAANIAFGHPDATREQVVKAATIAAADGFINELPKGYDTVLGESGVTLSGGQRQRLAIARAVLLEPAILILDDPTAAIDPETENEILEAMDNAMAGRTTFVVAHRLSTLRRADLILVLEDGRIVQQGTHEQLMVSDGHYLRVARLQLIDDETDRLLGGGGP